MSGSNYNKFAFPAGCLKTVAFLQVLKDKV
jgi:hypothetical protein